MINHSLIHTINERIKERPVDKNSQILTLHPEIFFSKNSVNLLIGPRESGKSFNVFREVAKVCQLNEENPYNLFVYVTDKTNDSTYKLFEPLITINKILVKYDDAEDYLLDLYECKAAYDEVIEKNLENLLTEDSKKDILDGVGVESFDKPWHTIVFFDDAQQIFKKKGKLYQLLFQNRQPRVTIFIALQDAIGIDTSIKSNINAYWLFGGFSRQKFVYHYNQISSPRDKEEIWNIYKSLGRHQAIVFLYSRQGTKIHILES